MPVNIEKLSKDFWKKGYLVLDNFFASEPLSIVDQYIRDHFGANPEFWHKEDFLKRAKTEVIPWFPQNSDLPEHRADLATPFDQLESNSQLRQLTRSILGTAWIPLYSMVMFSKKGTTGQAWHQDCPPENPLQFNLNRLVYTRDITDEIGGQTVVMPGSHRMGELPVGNPDEDLEGQVVLKPRKGTLVLLHGHTWHRVLPITGEFRYSTNFRACPAGTPANVTDVAVYRNMRYRFSTNSVIQERQPTA